MIWFKPLTTSEIKDLLEGVGPDTDWRVGTLAATIERLRLERDMLALNGGRKDPCVFVVMNGSEVDGVVWQEEQTGSSQTIKVPSYAASKPDVLCFIIEDPASLERTLELEEMPPEIQAKVSEVLKRRGFA